MSRWIDAEWLMNFFVDIPNNFTLTIGNLRATVNDAPSIDIVRCKECKWYGNEQKKIYECCTYWAQNGGVLVPMNADDFCSRGEREGE